jgi:hypothetical protein
MVGLLSIDVKKVGHCEERSDVAIALYIARHNEIATAKRPRNDKTLKV